MHGHLLQRRQHVVCTRLHRRSNCIPARELHPFFGSVLDHFPRSATLLWAHLLYRTHALLVDRVPGHALSFVLGFPIREGLAPSLTLLLAWWVVRSERNLVKSTELHQKIPPSPFSTTPSANNNNCRCHNPSRVQFVSITTFAGCLNSDCCLFVSSKPVVIFARS